MKKIIAAIAIIISFAILANSKVSATTLEAVAYDNNLLSKQEVIIILDASQEHNINIDLALFTKVELPANPDMKIAKTTTNRQTITIKQVNADD